MNVEQILIENLTTAISKLEAQPVKAFNLETDLCVYLEANTGARCLFGHCMKAPNPDLKAPIDASAAFEHLAASLGLTEDDLRPFIPDLVRLQVSHDNNWFPGTRFVDAMSNEDGGPLYQKLREALQ